MPKEMTILSTQTVVSGMEIRTTEVRMLMMGTIIDTGPERTGGMGGIDMETVKPLEDSSVNQIQDIRDTKEDKPPSY